MIKTQKMPVYLRVCVCLQVCICNSDMSLYDCLKLEDVDDQQFDTPR